MRAFSRVPSAARLCEGLCGRLRTLFRESDFRGRSIRGLPVRYVDAIVSVTSL
jgi:hypothetical protein